MEGVKDDMLAKKFIDLLDLVQLFQILDKGRMAEEAGFRKLEGTELAEYAVREDLVLDIYTMLKSLDQHCPFLQNTEFDTEKVKEVSVSKVNDVFESQIGSIEVLRGGVVERYVFRFEPEWNPSKLETVVDLKDVIEEILVGVKNENPQERCF